MIGDDDPADGYDRGDPTPLRLRVVALVLEAARHRRDQVELDTARHLLAEVLEDLRGLTAEDL